MPGGWSPTVHVTRVLEPSAAKLGLVHSATPMVTVALLTEPVTVSTTCAPSCAVLGEMLCTSCGAT